MNWQECPLDFHPNKNTFQIFASMEKKNNFKRRVSFASTLHVRLFDEEELQNEVSGDLQPGHQNDNSTRYSLFKRLNSIKTLGC